MKPAKLGVFKMRRMFAYVNISLVNWSYQLSDDRQYH